MDILLKYFPSLTAGQQQAFSKLLPLYTEWNEKINVISRKDIENLYERHILHSLAIAKVLAFQPGTKVLDVGTGGGFPGIPLAVLFPEVRFDLVDSIAKKIRVVNEVATALELKNVRAFQERVENLPEKYDFVVSRAVTTLPQIHGWVKDLFSKRSFNDLDNGILYLKGGDLDHEIEALGKKTKLYSIPDFFSEAFFETKKVVYVKMG